MYYYIVFRFAGRVVGHVVYLNKQRSVYPLNTSITSMLSLKQFNDLFALVCIVCICATINGTLNLLAAPCLHGLLCLQTFLALALPSHQVGHQPGEEAGGARTVTLRATAAAAAVGPEEGRGRMNCGGDTCKYRRSPNILYKSSK